MTAQLRLFLIALQFYTRLPVTGRLAEWVGWDTDRLGRSTRYFPLVGALVGVLQALVFMVASLGLPHPVALLLALAAGLLLTGAFHEDGWADFCDGLGVMANRARMLEVMRDSRIGAYGAIGLVVLLLLRYETLVYMDADWIAAALVCAAAFSRGCSVLVMISLPYARADDADAKAGLVAQHVPPADAIVALGIALLPLALLTVWIGDPTPAGLGVMLALLATAAIRRIIRRRLQGYTGDCLGAVQQVAEVAFLLGLLVALGVPIVETLSDSSS
jgi:adenosylcobinamide-GDP ribazoletransferase